MLPPVIPVMRLSESKVIIEALSEACGNAEGTGRIDVDALLSKPEVCRSHNIAAIS